jgi:hypothetical protein
MIQILPLAKIIHKDIVLEDDFNSKFEGWELVEYEDEHSFMKDSHYWMENKSTSRWMFYHKAMPVSKDENFILYTNIELINNRNGYGQFGLVWGFQKQHEVLNKFVISTQNQSFTIAQFQKDHHYTRHRYSGTYEKHHENKREQFLSIVKLDDYYYFFLNEFDRPVYITHVSQLQMQGNRFGFYVEPGIMIRSDKITIKRSITDKSYNGSLWMPLDEDEMPLGSQILRSN